MSRRRRRRPAPRASRSGNSCSSMGPPRPLLLHSSHSSCRHRSRWRPLYWVAKVASAAAVSGGLAVERRTGAAVASRSSAGSTQGSSGAGSWSSGSRGLGPSGVVASSAARRGGARTCAGHVAAARTTVCRSGAAWNRGRSS